MDTTFRNHLYQISIIFLQFINSVSTPPDRRHMSFKLFFIKFTVCYNILCGIYRHLIDGRRNRPKNIVVGHSKKSVMSCSKGVHGINMGSVYNDVVQWGLGVLERNTPRLRLGILLNESPRPHGIIPY